MRKILSFLVTSALLTTSAVQAATPADTLVVAIPLDGIISFDPAESFETVSTGSLINIYQRLVQADRHDQQKLAAELATSWQPGNSAHSLRIQLNPQATFASGNPVTASDIIFSLTRAIKLNKTPAFILGEFGWTADNIDAQFTRIDDHQLEIRWVAPIGRDLALRLLSSPVASIVDAKLAQQHASNNDYGNGWLRTHSAGSAAYAIRSFAPQQALVLEASPHAQPKPALKRVILKGVSDSGSRRLLLEQGDADVAYELGADQFDALRQRPGVRIEAFPSSLIYYLGFNTQQAGLGNPALWQAARWLVDYDSLSTQLLKGQYQVHQAFLPQGFDGALTTTPFHLDVAKAKAILQQAGIKPGTHFSLTVTNQPPYTDVAQALQASFAQADIHIDIQPVAEADLWGKMRARNFQAIFTYWGADYIDPNTNASTFAYNVPNGPKTLAWRVGWTIPALSQQTRAAAAESDVAQRRERYRTLQTEVQQNSPYVVMLQGKKLVALRDNVQGAAQGIGATMLYYDQVSKTAVTKE
ncbi:putative ABC transport system, periplasmic solute-binding protein precursor [Duffyella gerundensis]|uniref:Putative ABC transport system, periplasmic solute-binding protein n=1 Tax=Duffyella gerundensis TaxID=1619313 RepID=A0A0U5L624_9GAMM|nr:ABC transporter substrate-binding protein [Duffyella gerundensis]CUU25359.1 putative ABC transport system, periplasmic solute-binding protein precursor [Duffyella gerundensis]